MLQIITFYRFKNFDPNELIDVRDCLRSLMRRFRLKGTIILSTEGFNSTICGEAADVSGFITEAERVLGAEITFKSSFHDKNPFRRIDVKIKPEIVTLKKNVNISAGEGTHVPPKEWDRLLSDPEVTLLDARNHYEYKNGTFAGALDPGTAKFSELPDFVAQNLDSEVHKKIAMFCTGGIRCEKFAPFMKQLGFKEVYQLEGGILKYLEEVDRSQSRWIGECFVFDGRVTVDEDLRKGSDRDFSLESAE